MAIDIVLSAPFRRDFVIRQWLGHGLLDLEDLLSSQGTYAPASLVTIEA